MAGEGEKGGRREIPAEVIEQENRAAREQGTDDSHIIERGEGERPQPGEGEQPAEREAPKLRNGPFDDKRAALMAKAREQRHAADDGELVDQIAESRANRFAPETPVGGREEVEKKPAEPAAPVAKRKLTVHGKEIELTEDQIVEAAQKSLAAEGILEAAKAERAQAQQILEGLRAARENPPAPTAEPQQPAKKPEPENPLDDATLAALVDKIQVGDPKEAQEALQTYGAAIEQRVLAKIGNLDQRIAATADTVAESRRRQDETRQTLASFGDKNTDFKADEDLQYALAAKTTRLMREEMAKLNVGDDSIQQIMQKHKVDRETAIGAAYRMLSESGHTLPTHAEILDRSARAIRKSMGLPEDPPAARRQAPPSPTARNDNMNERVERKRVLSPQPRRAASPSPAVEQQERSREQSGRQAIQAMREHRRGRR